MTAPLAERVLACVEAIPPGCVMTYGDVAEYVGIRSARVVGNVLSRSGGGVPWHRVVRADGSCADQLAERQQGLLRSEGVPLERGRVVLARCRWDGSMPG